jgi:hypothetical protein
MLDRKAFEQGARAEMEFGNKPFIVLFVSHGFLNAAGGFAVGIVHHLAK